MLFRITDMGLKNPTYPECNFLRLESDDLILYMPEGANVFKKDF